jgi:D-lactate dehydrogenase
MRIAFFSTHSFDRQFFARANSDHAHEIVYFEPRLTADTCALAAGFPAVCAFVNDRLNAAVLDRLAAGGTRLVALRSAGFNNVDLPTAQRLGVTVVRVPAYSPYAVAEHTVALILSLNRKICRAYARVRDGNFALDGLLGFDLHGRTVGIVGTGKVGMLVARIMHGFGCTLLGYDVSPNDECQAMGLTYVPLAELWQRADIITLHAPLTAETRHLVDARALGTMKDGVMIVNTGRGALIDTPAVVAGLKSGRIGYLGLDVYEEEEALFFEDSSSQVMQDDVFARLLTFSNVIVTGHQGFFTREALEAIAQTTLANLSAFERGERSGTELY